MSILHSFSFNGKQIQTIEYKNDLFICHTDIKEYIEPISSFITLQITKKNKSFVLPFVSQTEVYKKITLSDFKNFFLLELNPLIQILVKKNAYKKYLNQSTFTPVKNIPLELFTGYSSYEFIINSLNQLSNQYNLPIQYSVIEKNGEKEIIENSYTKETYKLFFKTN